MSDIISERSNGILRVELNRPAKKNAMTGAMYTRLAEIQRASNGASRRA
jgi:enoyl-CoA hydratase/carnithine racemase